MTLEAGVEYGAASGRGRSEQNLATIPLIRISSQARKNDVKVSTPKACQESVRGSSPAPADVHVAANIEPPGKDDINWITRVQNRTDELRKLFDLPVTEVLHSSAMASSVSWASHQDYPAV